MKYLFVVLAFVSLAFTAYGKQKQKQYFPSLQSNLEN